MKRQAILLFVLAMVIVGGCGSSDSQSIPLDKRAPGQDISAADRADKRGDVAPMGANGK